MNKYFCYYSNKEYRQLAEDCVVSFQRFSLWVHLLALDDKKGWMRNCMARAVDLAHQAEENPTLGIGLLDADLTCYKTPHRLLNFDGDVAVHDKLNDPKTSTCPNSRYSAGVICFAPTLLGRKCLHRWAELCVADKDKGEVLREQFYLEQAIKEGRAAGLKVFNLGVHYNQPVSSETVILHHVESRRSRDKIGGGM